MDAIAAPGPAAWLTVAAESYGALLTIFGVDEDRDVVEHNPDSEP